MHDLNPHFSLFGLSNSLFELPHHLHTTSSWFLIVMPNLTHYWTEPDFGLLHIFLYSFFTLEIIIPHRPVSSFHTFILVHRMPHYLSLFIHVRSLFSFTRISSFPPPFFLYRSVHFVLLNPVGCVFCLVCVFHY